MVVQKSYMSSASCGSVCVRTNRIGQLDIMNAKRVECQQTAFISDHIIACHVEHNEYTMLVFQRRVIRKTVVLGMSRYIGIALYITPVSALVTMDMPKPYLSIA